CVRQRDYRRLLDAGLRAQRLLNIAGKPGAASDRDQLCEAPAHGQIPVAIHDAGIARMQPATAQGLPRLLGLPPITRHQPHTHPAMTPPRSPPSPPPPGAASLPRAPRMRPSLSGSGRPTGANMSPATRVGSPSAIKPPSSLWP